jgi:RNA polymerase sigma-70 factor (ECF subfamily)
MSRPGLVRSADADVVAGLRTGDSAVFDALVTRYHSSFVYVAQSIVRDRSIAEDVAQETWLAVLRAIDGFEQRSSLQTWLYRILVNIARGRARVERRTVPFSGLGYDTDDSDDDEVRAAHDSVSHASWAWRSTPDRRDADPHEWAQDGEVRAALAAAMRTLPARQRAVLQLRDVQGFSSDEVSTLLNISSGNQRVLLHRARARMRTALVGHVSIASGAGSRVGSDRAWDWGENTATSTPIASQLATM